MQYVILSCLVFVFAACNTTDDSQNKTVTDPTDIASTSAPATTPLTVYADSIAALQTQRPMNTAKAAGYFNHFMFNDSATADSAAVLLVKFMNDVAKAVNERLIRDTADYARLKYVVGATPTSAQKQFMDELKAGHILLQDDGEGGVLAEPDYGWLRTTIQEKTSTGVDDYISLIQREAINPTVLDGGIAIEMRGLVDRTILAERLQNAKLPSSFAKEILNRLQFYTNTLLFGVDNSPALENSRGFTLSQEFQQGYDYALTSYPSSALAATLQKWMAVLKTKDAAKANAFRAIYKNS